MESLLTQPSLSRNRPTHDETRNIHHYRTVASHYRARVEAAVVVEAHHLHHGRA
jgi:hypothetical protein